MWPPPPKPVFAANPLFLFLGRHRRHVPSSKRARHHRECFRPSALRLNEPLTFGRLCARVHTQQFRVAEHTFTHHCMLECLLRPYPTPIRIRVEKKHGPQLFPTCSAFNSFLFSYFFRRQLAYEGHEDKSLTHGGSSTAARVTPLVHVFLFPFFLHFQCP